MAGVLNRAVVARSGTDTRAQRRNRIFRKKVLPWMFVLPILLLHLVVIVGPSIGSLYYSLTEWTGIGEGTFIGLKNFQRIFFEDLNYGEAFGHNLGWLIFFLTIPFILALAAASTLARIRRGSMFFRAALFIPFLLPPVVTASIWRNLFSPTLGLGAELAKIGIKGLDIAYLGRPETVLPAIAFVDNWHFWGFLMVVFLAAMQNVPPELYDVAKIDGANRWQEFWNVTFPGIRPTVAFMLLMVTIWSFLAFNYVWILTQGGPAGASEVLGTLVVKSAFFKFEAGYAAAMGVTMSLFAGVAIAVFGLLRRLGWEL
jgi:raffinose/stachyose/melibiose transport system permease protein